MLEPVIHPFDESLKHREILPYNPVYEKIYRQMKDFIESHYPDIEIDHIGSTAIRDLRGKPMIDLFALTSATDLRFIQANLEKLGFHRRSVSADRDDKPYICGSVLLNGGTFNINIHVSHKDSENYKGIVRFRDFLRQRADLRRRYEEAKDQAHSIAPADHEAYNKAKAPVMMQILEELDDHK